MHLRRIEISAFRCFKDRIVIDDIGDGITLLVGENEEGKSTVLDALQTILFEKHSVVGRVADAMLPYGSKVRPEIRLTFDNANVRYSLYKAFCQSPQAHLEAESGERWAGDAVEEQLRKLLEFTPPGRGGAKPDHRGLQALFWVEQGSGHQQPHMTETAQSNIVGALEVEVGTVTGGERGRTLIKRIDSRLSKFFTLKNKKPSGAYKQAIKDVEEIRNRSDELAEKLENFESRVDEIARQRSELAQLEADDPIGTANERLKQANEAVRKVEGLEANLETARANFKSSQSQQELAKLQLESRRKGRLDVDASKQDARDHKTEKVAAQEAVSSARTAYQKASEAHKKAKSALRSAQDKAVAGQRLAHLLHKIEELETAQNHLTKAKAADHAAKDLAAKANASPFSRKALDKLQKLDSETRDAVNRLEAVATRVDFTPDAGRRAFASGQAVETTPLTLTEPTQIRLEGYGEILVTPGGEDISTRSQAAETAASKLRLALEKFGAENIQDAVRQAQDRETWLKQAEINRNIVENHAPDGVDALESKTNELSADINRIQQAMLYIEETSITLDKAIEASEGLNQILEAAKAEERNSWDQFKDSETYLALADNAAKEANERLEQAEEKALSLEQELNEAAKIVPDNDLEKALRDKSKAMQAASEEAERIEKALSERDPKGARQELKAATEARDRVEKRLQELRQKIRDTDVALRTLGQNDMAADLEIAKGRLARSEALKERLNHEATALALLHETLLKEEQDARETFLGPVRRHVEPYLKRLFPGSDLVLDDRSLNITHLRRNNQDEPYERLSIGTREQIAVLVRLAFGDLLREHGKQSPIILDDALVFSDDGRIEEMQRILDRAAERLQIVVLTCHERTYFQRGWATKRIRDCRV